MKAMEDVMVHYDRTVRNSICEVLQFLYGEDGMNGEYVEDQTVELMLLDNDKLRRLYRHDVEQQESYGKGWILDEEVRTEILTDFELQQVLEEEYEAIKEDKNRLCRHIFKDGETKQHIPINVLRLLEFAKAQFPATPEQLRKQNPLEIAKKVNELLQEKLVVVKQTNKTDTISVEVQDNATIFMKAHLRTVLNSRRLLERERLGPKAFQVSQHTSPFARTNKPFSSLLSQYLPFLSSFLSCLHLICLLYFLILLSSIEVEGRGETKRKKERKNSVEKMHTLENEEKKKGAIPPYRIDQTTSVPYLHISYQTVLRSMCVS